MGLRMNEVFQEARLRVLALRGRARRHGAGLPVYEYAANATRGLPPTLEQMGIATAAEVKFETLAERLRAEVVGAHGAVTWAPLVSAWTRKPLA